MKNLGKFFALAITAALASCNNTPTETVEATDAQEVEVADASATYAVNTSGDEIRWTGSKSFVEGKHTGTIQVAEGELNVEDGNLVGGSFVIDMNSINNEDLTDAEYKAKLEGHLKSEDFFHTSEYPTATFTITRVEEVADSETGATHNISGNLMMRGKEKNITFPATVKMEGDVITVTTPEFGIDRMNWDVKYNNASITSLAKDNIISDEIVLVVNFTAEKA